MSILLFSMAAMVCGTALVTAWPSAAARSYTCETDAFCKCPSPNGCSVVSELLGEPPFLACRDASMVFTAQLRGRKLTLNGEAIAVGLREVRPYFSDLDWYLSGASQTGGVLNMSFNNESVQGPFFLRYMAQSSVNDSVWTLSGRCEGID